MTISLRLSCGCILMAALSGLLGIAQAEDGKASPTERARYSQPERASFDLAGGSKLTVVIPNNSQLLKRSLVNAVNELHLEYQTRWGMLKGVQATLVLMDEEQFFASTGAPSWTNALYHRGNIIIPISSTNPPRLDSLRRSVRHEYTHAVVNALSEGRCPGWIDEGLAQAAEGPANPILKRVLLEWLQKNDPVPLEELQGGFTKLPAFMVAPAYAQALFAVNVLNRSYGSDRFVVLFDELRAGKSTADSFKKAFGLRPSQYEHRLRIALRRWAESLNDG